MVRPVCRHGGTAGGAVHFVWTVPADDHRDRLVPLQFDADDLQLGRIDRPPSLLWGASRSVDLDPERRGSPSLAQGAEGMKVSEFRAYPNTPHPGPLSVGE